MTVVLGVIIVVLLVFQVWERRMHRQDIADLLDKTAAERRGLEDRLIALTDPVALTQVKAVEDPTPGGIRYVDEEPGTDTTQRGGLTDEA